MQVNGQPYPHREGLTLHALLSELHLTQEKVAVAHNDEFYPSTRIPDVQLAERDIVEIVRAVAGG